MTPVDHCQYPDRSSTAGDAVDTPVLTTATSPISPGVTSTLTLTGSALTTYCRARVNRQQRPTTYVSSTELQVQVYAADAVSGASLVVDVQSLVPPYDGSTAYSGDVTVTVS